MSDLNTPGAPQGIDRRGMDAAVIALIKQLHEQFVDSHAEVHETFVAVHTREHELSGAAHERALQLAHENIRKEVAHLNTLLGERDKQYQERSVAAKQALDAAYEAREKALKEAFDAREKALTAALESKDKAVAAAFESAEKAIQKAEISIEKRADATYVSLTDLQRQLSQLMPRQEAENRYVTIAGGVDDLKERVGRVESMRAGGKEAITNIQMFLGMILALFAITGFIVGTR